MTFKEIIVVEGNHDVAKIKSVFNDAECVITNGREIDQKTLELLKALNESRGLILMLDPDAPGNKIRQIINDYVGPTKHVFLKKSDCIDVQKNKVGIEHASSKVIKKALLQSVKEDVSRETISFKDFVSLKLTGSSSAKNNREKVCDYYHLGRCNAKTMWKRLNMFGVTKAMIEDVLK